jgi:salicylate hydroxylase
MGQDAHVLTFPVNGGDTLNIVAFKTSKQDWPDSQRLTRRATRKELLHDFRDFGEPLRRLLSLTSKDLDVVSVFFGPAR